jgi:hypothetical protein
MVGEQAGFFKCGVIGAGAIAASPRAAPPDGILPRPHGEHTGPSADGR